MPRTPGSYLRRGAGYVTPANVRAARAVYSGLRGTRLFGGTTRRRASGYARPRMMRYRRRKVMRRYKMYRRTLKPPRQRSLCISTSLMGTSTGVPARTASQPIVWDRLNNNNVEITYGKLGIQAIPYPTKPDAASTSIRKRDTNHINLHGFKINRTFYLENAAGGPMVVNWALLQFRKGSYEDMTGSGVNLLNRFFRFHADTDDETISFPEFTEGPGAAIWSNEMNTCAINPDMEWTVLTHKRRVLRPYSATHADWSHENKQSWRMGHEWNISAYYKVGKPVSFYSTASDLPEQVIAEVFWYAPKNELHMPTDASFGHLRCLRQAATYWSPHA